MSTQTVAPLGAFSEWIRTTDAHATYHLQLLEEASRVLESTAPASAAQRAEIADRLERWRYQLLKERQGNLREEDFCLAEALDLTANRLAGRPDRPARCVRKALLDASLDTDSIREAQAGLDPRFPLDRLSTQARQLTEQHFQVRGGNGSAPARRRMFLYVPLYLSNYCTNHCLYCGFRYPEGIPRRQLSPEQAMREAEVLYGWGFRHVLLVAGDFPSRTTTAYFASILRWLVTKGVQPSIEIAPQSTAAYAELCKAGASGITLYQETYDEEFYRIYHPRGTKASYDWRVEGLERAAEAGFGRLGLGILLGLADPQRDVLAMLRHARYLQERFPDRILAFSLPRIHDAPTSFRIPYPVSDELLIRLYCVLRIAFPKVELVLSTREPAELRNRLARICITQMSAGSSTAPGGYADLLPEATSPSDLHSDLRKAAPQGDSPRPILELHHRPGEQFPVADHRTPAEVVQWLQSEGFEIVWQGEVPQASGCLR